MKTFFLASIIIFVSSSATVVWATPSPISSPTLQKRITVSAPVTKQDDGGEVLLGFDAGGNLITSTTSDITFYVNADGGNDSNSCTDAGAPCLTIQGGINKSPKVLHHKVSVLVSPGNYQGFLVGGFTQDNSFQNVTGGLLIQGTLGNSTTLDGGVASGVVTSSTAGSGSTWGTLTDSTQHWTTDDLRGRFLAITSGTGTSTTLFRVISSNTPTTLTVVATGLNVDTTTHYSIQDSTSVIASGIPQLPQPLVNGTGTGCSMMFESNSMARIAGITVTNFRLTNPVAVSGVGAVSIENAAGVVELQNIQNYAASTSHYTITGSGAGLTLFRSYSYYNTTAHDNKFHIAMQSGAARVFVLGSLFEQGEYGLTGANSNGSISWTNNETHMTYRGVSPFGSVDFLMSNSRIGCEGSLGEWGLEVGENHDGATAGGYANVTGVNFDNCSIMFQQGGGFLQVSAVTGVASLAVIKNLGGGHAVFTQSGIFASSDAGTDIILGSNGVMTANFSDIAGQGSCIMSMVDSSSICKN